MPSSTSVRCPVADSVMVNSSESRNAAQAAAVDIFWVYQKIDSAEENTAKTHGIPDTRIVHAKQGGGSYLLHTMFLDRNQQTSLSMCGITGDIWVSDPRIYVRTTASWSIASTEPAHATVHPFLGQQRQLALHPLHFTLQWTLPSTIRQHRGKWKQETINQISHPGILELVQGEELRAIIETRYQNLNSAQIARYLSITLCCFLDEQKTEELTHIQPTHANDAASSHQAEYVHRSLPDRDLATGIDHDTQEEPDNSLIKEYTSADLRQTDIIFQQDTTSQASPDKSPIAEHNTQEDPNESLTNMLTINQDQGNTPIEKVTASSNPLDKSSTSEHDVSIASSDELVSRHQAQIEESDTKYNARNYHFFNEAVVGATPKINTSGNTLEADEKLVKWMSTGQDATASSHVDGKEIPSIVQVFNFPSHASLREKMDLAEKIHGVLASGRAVALVPATSEPELEWNAENIGYLLTGTPGDCSTVVNWQSTHKRNTEHQKHRNPEETSYWIDLCQKGSIEEFLAKVEAHDESVNCLDAPQAAGYAPDMINLLANDCHAWNITSSIGYADAQPTTALSKYKNYTKTVETRTGELLEEHTKSVDVSITGGFSDLSDLSPLTSDEENEDREFEIENRGTRHASSGTKRKGPAVSHKRPHKQTKKAVQQSKTQKRLDTYRDDVETNTNTELYTHSDYLEFQYTGTRNEGALTVERDVDRMRRWMLLGSSHFYTYPHHDAAGLVTWTCLLNGLKIWSYIVPKEQPKNMEDASKIYTKLIQSLHHIGVNTENRLPSLATTHNLFLFPGTLLIQPPGLIHQVLTVKNSITRGGHLLTWNAIHLTEWTRKLSHNCYRVGTNDLHPGVQHTLGRMMLAISTKGPTTMLRKPFMSLARLIIHADQYWRGDYELNDETKIPKPLKRPFRNADLSQKEAWNEHSEATNIAKAILRWNGIEELEPMKNIINQKKEALGFILQYANNEERNIAWYEAGSDVIQIPQFPRL
ncbi:hypothetical protein BDY19DRAFT_908924 [Irpex rosettiformis]|uniref:Uncharacterized protein n=1 Tax=Irpex rosettiformis TaxID=378272 RepID=A0ACB8TUH7_9APHY|nr:hypothetical protein BDY19DRAFT_908924 [Irpex rosettiformis]